MKEQIRQIAHTVKSALFTIVIHGILLAALLAGLWWPFSENKVERGHVQPIQAQAVTEQEVQEIVNQQEKKIEEEKQRVQEELENIQKKQEEEKKKLEELEVKRKQEEEKKKQQAEEEKLALKKKEEEEIKRKEEEERKKKEDEKKRKEAEKKKQEEEKKRKEEEARKKKQAEEARKKKQAEDELKKKLAEERTQAEAANALSALVDRIAVAVENNWRRPVNSQQGRVAYIRVRVARNGEVLSTNVVKSSGDRLFDQSGEIAIKKASPLPFPSDPQYYEYINEFDLKFSPDD